MIGGGNGVHVLREQGLPTGRSLVEEDKIELAGRLIANSAASCAAAGSRGW